MIIFLIIILGMVIYLWYTAVKKENQRIEDRKLERKMEKEQRQRIIDLQREREENPLLCEVCTKKKRKKTYFEGLACYHCPVCNSHGFASIYGSKGECTGCSNLQRFGSLSGY